MQQGLAQGLVSSRLIKKEQQMMRNLGVFLLFLAAFLAAPVSVKSQEEDDGAVPVLVEVPGYAKLVRGTYGKHTLSRLVMNENLFF